MNSEGEVLYITRFVPAYRRPILELLNDKLNGRLVVCSGDPPGKSSLNFLASDGKPRYRQIALRNIWLKGESIHFNNYKVAFDSFPKATCLLLEESPRSVGLPLIINYAKRNKLSTLLWGHFSSNGREIGSRNLRDQYRLYLARKVDAIVCYSDNIAFRLQSLVDSSKVFIARNTLDTRTLFNLHKSLIRKGKPDARRNLGLNVDSPVVLFVGRLIKEKGMSRLVETFEIVSSRHPGAQLVLIGDGPEKSFLQREADNRSLDLTFTGAMPDLSESAAYIFASDVLLNPGYVGLSINHALSLGVPVVAPSASATSRAHSPEWEFIKNGYNGILTGDSDAVTLADAVDAVLADQHKYSTNAFAFAEEQLTMERMVDGLVRSIEYAEHVNSS